MAQIVESTPQRLVMQFGSTRLALDKTAATATLHRKMLFWSLKPLAKPLSDIVEITVDTATDRASGVEVCHAMVVMRTGDARALAETEKKSAQDAVEAIREFLELKSA
jgi:hypothetical protein